MQKQKLGPLQEMWVKSLEDNPERQMRKRLGKGTPESYKACCLGEALVCIAKFYIEPLPFKDGEIVGDDECTSYLSTESARKIGLYGITGLITEGKKLGQYSLLSSANDNGVTWPKIAAFIRANPEAVFFKEV